MLNKNPFIIAEIAQGYEGKEDLVWRFVEAAIKSSADAVKFQIFYADELALPDYQYYRLFKSLELPLKVWDEAIRQAHQAGLEFYSDVFGLQSLRELDSIGIDGFKIHTTDINNLSLLKAVALLRKKVFLSTGGCLKEEVEKALDILNSCQVTLMYGFQAEPTEIVDNNLNRILTLRDIFKNPIGFQDHIAGDAKLAFYLPFIALGLGAVVFEKHLTLDRKLKMEDYISALEPQEFKLWADNLKEAYLALGQKKWELQPKEREYRSKVKRGVVALKDIKKGKNLEETDLILKRTQDPEAIFEIGKACGKKALEDIMKNSVVKERQIR